MADRIYQVNLTATSLDGVMADPEVALLQEHIKNGDIHVLASDKAIWTAKASQKDVDDLVVSINNVSSIANVADAQFSVLAGRLAALEDQIISLKQTDVLIVNDIAAANDATKDLIISIDNTVTAVNNITGKSVDIKTVALESGRFNISATDDVVIKNMTTTGNLAKSVSNAAISINNSGYIRIADSVMDQTGYNVIEIGLNRDAVPKSVTIDNVKFNGAETNNVVSIFNTEDGAVINISNCSFAHCSNPIRISNRDGRRLIINVVNCEFGIWDSGEYAGMIICQDYTSPSAEAAATNNLFSPDKVTINIINCTKGGEPIVAADPATICGTKQDSQLLYVYRDKSGFVLYDAEVYPTINIK